MATQIVGLVDQDTLLRDERNEAWSYVLGDDRRRLLRIRSASFKRLLAKLCYSALERVPGNDTLGSALNVIEARAESAPRVTLWNRCARGQDNAFWIDMADERGQAIRVASRGWKIVDGRRYCSAIRASNAYHAPAIWR